MALGVVVTWYARPGTEERVEEILTEMTTFTRDEPGCLIYQPHRAVDTPGMYLIYEQFADMDAFKAHLASGHYARLILAEVGTLLEKRDRSLHTTIDLS